MSRLCSGEIGCRVIGTSSLPIRALRRSPPLMWMSDAPRWIAAFRISIILRTGTLSSESADLADAPQLQQSALRRRPRRSRPDHLEGGRVSVLLLEDVERGDPEARLLEDRRDGLDQRRLRVDRDL